jgi:hypothetical protein
MPQADRSIQPFDKRLYHDHENRHSRRRAKWKPNKEQAGGAARCTAFLFALKDNIDAVPRGFTASGLPIGLQISGAHFDELTVFALAHGYEQATEWHKKRPTLST